MPKLLKDKVRSQEACFRNLLEPLFNEILCIVSTTIKRNEKLERKKKGF